MICIPRSAPLFRKEVDCVLYSVIPMCQWWSGGVKTTTSERIDKRITQVNHETKKV